MSVKDIKGINVEIGGTVTKLDAALKQSDTAASGLQRELIQVNRLLKFDPTNTELLTQKQKLLEQQLTENKTKLQTLKTAQEQFATSGGDLNSEEYRALQREIAQTEQSIKRAEQQQKEFGSVSARILQETGEKWKQAGDKISGAGQNMLPATAGIVAFGAIATSYASSTAESINKVEVAFSDSAEEVLRFSETTIDSYGIAKGTALGMSSLYGDMATSMGLAPKAAADISTSLTGLAGDLASFKDVELETAENALKGIFTGETESLKNLGVVMTQANLDAYALANGYKTTSSQMTEAEKVQLRYSYVMDATKNAQGDFMRTADGTANSIRTAKEATKEMAASFGDLLAPIVAKIAQAVIDLIKKITNMSDSWKATVLVFAGIIAAIGPLLIVIGKLATGVGALMQVGAKLGPLFAGAGSAAGGAATATGALGKVMAALTGPIGLIIASVVALIAVFVHLFKSNEDFRNKVLEVWENVKSKIISVIEAIKPALEVFAEFFSMLWETIQQIFGAAMDAIAPILTSLLELFNTIFNNIYEQVMPTVQFLVDFLQTAWANCKDAIALVLDGLFLAFQGVFDLISSTISGIVNILTALISGDFDQMKVEIDNTLQAMWQAIVTIWNGIVLTISGTLAAIWGFIKTIWDSIVVYLNGVWTSITMAITNAWNGFLLTISNTCNTINTAVKNIWNDVVAFLGGIWVSIAGAIANAWSGFLNTISTLCGNIGTRVREIWNGILDFFRGLPGTLMALGSSMFTSMANGISSVADAIYNAATSCVNRAVDWIKAIPAQAVTWGKDMINGLANGIYNAAQAVIDRVKSIASTIASYLHFSCPDVGPLSTYEEWMPDFMQGLAKGIEKTKYLVENAVKGVAGDMTLNLGAKKVAQPVMAQASAGAVLYQTNHISSPKALTPSETARQVRAQTQRMVAKMKR